LFHEQSILPLPLTLLVSFGSLKRIDALLLRTKRVVIRDLISLFADPLGTPKEKA
jgi:hypothetical protein